MRLELQPLVVEDVDLSVGELIALPDDHRAWIDHVIGDFERTSDDRMRTRTGWPVRIVVTRAGAKWRAHAFYAFFEHAAVAMLSADSEDRVRECTSLLETAMPCWRDGIAALSELWD